VHPGKLLWIRRKRVKPLVNCEGATSATPQHVCGSGVLLGWEPLVIDVVGWNPQGRFDDDSPFSQGEIS